MKPQSHGAIAAALVAVSLLVPQAMAQNTRSPPGAQNASSLFSLSRPTGRFGRTLGLPKDGKDLFIADEDYIRFPLPPGEEGYADVDAFKIKALIGEITAISRKSRDDGNQYWGRIAGTAYDRMTQDWVIGQFKRLGLTDIRRQRCAADASTQEFPRVRRCDLSQVRGEPGGRAFADLHEGAELPHHRPRDLPYDARHCRSRPGLGPGGRDARVPEDHRRREPNEETGNRRRTD
jgi:hypothetical protein